MVLILAEILGPDLLILLAIVFLLFGGKQLPKLARSLGAAKSEFEEGIKAGVGEAESTEPSEETPAPSPDTPSSNGAVTVTRAELEALIAKRDARAKDSPHSP